MNVTVKTIVKGPQIWVDGEQLRIEESRAIRNHSKEFAWGYAGSGPAQTALGCCLFLFGPYIAPMVYQRFKFDHVQNWYRWEDSDHKVDIEKFYFNNIEGEVLEHALSKYSQNVCDRLYAALTGDQVAASLIAEGEIVNSQAVQTRIIMGAFNKSIEGVADAMNLSYINFDGRWNIMGTMPTTRYLRRIMAIEKNILEV
jgi:hypothetical protein